MSPNKNSKKAFAPSKEKSEKSAKSGSESKTFRSNLTGNLAVLERLTRKMAWLDLQPNEEAFIVPLGQLAPNPAQPRRFRDEDRDRELAADIEVRGLLQPLVVRPLDGGMYQLVAGERRYRAAELAGLKEVPVILKNFNDEQALFASLVENVQRQDLDPLDEGRFYDFLNIQENLSIRDIAAFIHRSPTYVFDRLQKYREQIAPSAANDISLDTENNAEEDKRSENERKLNKSQSSRITPVKTVNRFRDYLTNTQAHLVELEKEEKLALAEQLRELRRQMETIEYELLNS